ncbi:hypothetical protein TSO352_25870 [Azospirillum sp. TSO35-2]|nr:hypothetical protein TSO352_25870 [Azospirillum sp. TSO35-2]
MCHSRRAGGSGNRDRRRMAGRADRRGTGGRTAAASLGNQARRGRRGGSRTAGVSIGRTLGTRLGVTTDRQLQQGGALSILFLLLRLLVLLQGGFGRYLRDGLPIGRVAVLHHQTRRVGVIGEGDGRETVDQRFGATTAGGRGGSRSPGAGPGFDGIAAAGRHDGQRSRDRRCGGSHVHGRLTQIGGNQTLNYSVPLDA